MIEVEKIKKVVGGVRGYCFRGVFGDGIFTWNGFLFHVVWTYWLKTYGALCRKNEMRLEKAHCETLHPDMVLCLNKVN